MGSFVLKLLLEAVYQNGSEEEEKMTGLVSAPQLGQTVFVSDFRCLFEGSGEQQMDGVSCITDR